MTALADALGSATPEMLRGWAAIAVARDVNDREDLARMGASPSTNPANNAFLGLAALALAVAEMQENGHAAALSAEDEAEGWGVSWNVYADGDSSLRVYLKRPNTAAAVTIWVPEPPDESNGHPTLPAALASLLRGAP